MVNSILVFEEGSQVVLAHLQSQLNQLYLVQHLESYFLCLGSKCNDPDVCFQWKYDGEVPLHTLVNFVSTCGVWIPIWQNNQLQKG
jgi:hypothetical protein